MSIWGRRDRARGAVDVGSAAEHEPDAQAGQREDDERGVEDPPELGGHRVTLRLAKGVRRSRRAMTNQLGR